MPKKKNSKPSTLINKKSTALAKNQENVRFMQDARRETREGRTIDRRSAASPQSVQFPRIDPYSLSRDKAKLAINALFAAAHTAPDAVHAKEAIRRARKIAMAQRLRLPKSLNQQICRRCNALLTVGNIRIIKSIRSITCACGHVKRL